MAEDKINKPSHYVGRYGLEVIDVVKNFIFDLAGVSAFYFSNVIKYMLRFQKKNGLEDLKKARKNLDWLIEAQGGTEMKNNEWSEWSNLQDVVVKRDEGFLNVVFVDKQGEVFMEVDLDVPMAMKLVGDITCELWRVSDND